MLDELIQRLKLAEVRSLPMGEEGTERIDVVSVGFDLQERDFIIACLEQCGDEND